jgi:hypothetical protein
VFVKIENRTYMSLSEDWREELEARVEREFVRGCELMML